MSDAELVKRFAELHQGGAIADLYGGGVRPRKDAAGAPTGHNGASWYINVEAHLFGEEPLAVYPILRDANELWFGAIDWDIGDNDSLVHAYNVEQALAYLDINSFVEMSRSKGVHLWIYVDQPVKAGWYGGVLYLEVHTMHPYGLEENQGLKPNIRLLPKAASIIQAKAGVYIGRVNWENVTKIVKKASDIPEAILTIY